MMDSVALSSKDCTSWQGLMLTVSLLTCWLLPTTAKLTIESVPPIAVQGDNVLLLVHNLPKKVKTVSWYTGVAALKSCEIARHVIATNSSVVGLAHSGRETVLNNGSLLIKSVTRKDSGYYTLQILDSASRPEIIHAEFFVHSPLFGYRSHLTPSQLKIGLVPHIVEENDNISLLAYNLPEKSYGFAWHKGVLPLDHLMIASHSFFTNSTILGHAYYDRLKVSNDGSLLLLNVTQKDTGIYTLRTISVDLKSEWAMLDLQVNKPGSRASLFQRPTSKPRPSKNRRRKPNTSVTSFLTLYSK
ncbi:carcinoembryonic antigen-related cell adhesion molecule 3-like [Grammomys surdaster]|uniref:carcinoembryonic antigen-related cell adhesion molecule 3-like n=1 Tax=Grammomys surdaster TaxID=491861 RepID=UPI0010A0B5E9|nr:carcinoembryonic antigen-related cell adhesion molecule 3-like [Grammomys surdaster]